MRHYPHMLETAPVEAYSPSVNNPTVPANTGVSHLEPEEICDILRWDAQGLTQEQIGHKFNPPRSQATICRTLQQYGADSRVEAKRILAAGAAPAAIKVLQNGRPRDLIAVLQGVDVLSNEQVGGMTIIVGSESQVQINVGVSPSLSSIDGRNTTQDK